MNPNVAMISDHTNTEWLFQQIELDNPHMNMQMSQTIVVIFNIPGSDLRYSVFIRLVSGKCI